MSETHDNDAAQAEAADALVTQAEQLGAEERWDELRALLLEELEDHGEDPRVLCWLGIASQRMGEDGEAYELFRRTLALAPTDPFVLASAGSGVAAYDDPEAEGALRLAALTAPDFPFARSAYGAYLAREGLFGEAVAELEAARQLAPEDAGILAELGMAELLAGRAEDGIARLEDALSQGDDAWLRGVFALALLDAGRGEEGAEQLHRAASERPEDVEVQLLSALASAAQGWEDEAWNALARAEQGAEAVDSDLLEEVEAALGEGAEAASELLRTELAPSVLRERLLQRA